MTVSPAAAQAPKPASPQDEYFAYFVRTTVKREAQQKSPAGPVTVPLSLVITEGPWINFSHGLARSIEIRRDGVCRIVEPALGSPGRATCYPPHLVQLVEVVSPQD